MLSRLFIKNIALIDSLEIEFSTGLNILTGETGAGKSIIVDSINMILGSRTSKDIIKYGESFAIVEAFFDIDNEEINDFLKVNSLDDNDNSHLILSREINTNGKNICRINGRAVPLSILKEIGQYLIDIHGQHDNQSLLNVQTHIDLLDSFGGEQIQKIKKEYIELFNKYKEIERKINELGGDKLEQERRLDLLKYQFNEISSARLKENEEKELEEKRNIIVNSSKMVSGIEKVYDCLCQGENMQSIIDTLNLVLRELSYINKFDTKIDMFINSLEEIYYNAEDISSQIRDYKENLQFDPSHLEEIEERIDLIYKLKRKYGNSVKEILEYQTKLQEEIFELESSGEILQKLSQEIDTISKLMNTKALELSKMRKNIAKDLEEKIVRELDDLNIKRAKFKVSFDEEKTKYTSKGIDKLEFLISPNAGQELKSLAKIASGGEMSRIMLAIKTILAHVDKVPTLIFDEIDIGISGLVAQMVGQKLSSISKNHQTLCITHLAQIAAMSDYHYVVEKYIENNHTKTIVKKLDGEEKKYEIARIIGGMEITEATLRNAEEIIQYATGRKNA